MARSTRRTFLAFSALSLASLRATGASAQTRAAYLDQPATVRIVGHPARGAQIPLLVVLPCTGGSAEMVYEALAPSIPLDTYAVLLPAGTPQSSDYLPGFSRYLGWYEARLLEDVRSALATHPIHAECVHLAGFSLGGDLAWALLVRQPATFRGALVIGSRCSAALRPAATETLKSRDARVAFAIGTSDDAARVSGLTRAHDRVRAAGIPTVLLRYEGGHQLPHDEAVLGRGFTQLYGRGEPASDVAGGSGEP